MPGASAYFLGGAVVYTRDARRLLADISDEAMKGNPLGVRALRAVAGEPDPRTLFDHLGPVGNRRYRADPETATVTPQAIAAWRSQD